MREALVNPAEEAYRAYTALQARAQLDDGGLSVEEWTRLRNMSDKQLRNWVKVGKTMAGRGHDSPMRNALAWLGEPAPELPEGAGD